MKVTNKEIEEKLTQNLVELMAPYLELPVLEAGLHAEMVMMLSIDENDMESHDLYFKDLADWYFVRKNPFCDYNFELFNICLDGDL